MNIHINYVLLLVVFFKVILLGCAGQDEKIKECMRAVEGTKHDPVYVRFCQKMTPVFDFDDALLTAQQDNKPILVYFNSLACVNCRTFEDKVFFSPKIVRHLSEKFTIAVLFTDENLPLQREGNNISPITGKKIRHIGGYNSDLQVLLTSSGGQPRVCVFNFNREQLSYYKGSLISGEEFENWLTEVEDLVNSK